MVTTCRFTFYLAIVLGGLLGLLGCSGSSSLRAGAQPMPDISQLPPRDQVIIASEFGQWDLLKELIESDPRLARVRYPNGMTLLHNAAVANNIEMVQFLLEKGVDPRIEDENGIRASGAAKFSGASKNLVDMLISAEAEWTSQKGPR